MGRSWRFDTVARDTPTDTMTVTLNDWGYYDTQNGESNCFGRSYKTGLRFRAARSGGTSRRGWTRNTRRCADAARLRSGGLGIPGPPIFPRSTTGTPAASRRRDRRTSKPLAPRDSAVWSIRLILVASDALTAHPRRCSDGGFYGYVVAAPEATFLADGSTLTLRWFREAGITTPRASAPIPAPAAARRGTGSRRGSPAKHAMTAEASPQ